MKTLQNEIQDYEQLRAIPDARERFCDIIELGIRVADWLSCN